MHFKAALIEFLNGTAHLFAVLMQQYRGQLLKGPQIFFHGKNNVKQ
jgi:hypothetical protein